MEHPVPIQQLSPQVARICGPDAPRQLKEAAASGQAPVGPADLLVSLYVLAYDTAQGLADTARQSLETLPERVLLGALDQMAHASVIDGLARILVRRSPAVERMLLNRAVADETVEWITTKTHDEKILEMVAANEQRLLRFPRIIEALYNNKAARMSTADRVVELAVRHGITLNGIACFEEVKAAIQGKAAPQPAAPAVSEETRGGPAIGLATAEDLFFRQNLDREDWKALDGDELVQRGLERDDWLNLDDDAIDEAVHGKKITDEEAEAARKIATVEASLAKLGVSAKVRLAALGSAGQRAVLIRDSNRLVAMAVVKSPTLSDSERQQYSRYRTLSEEALRYMAKNREWVKHYSVKLNLVTNPRTPIEFSLRLLNFLRPNDVASIMRDKNVPQAVARAAKQLKDKRTL